MPLIFNGHCGHRSRGFTTPRVGNDFSVTDFDDALRPRGDLSVMRDNDDGATFAVQL